jgi:uncharacterized protein HemX
MKCPACGAEVKEGLAACSVCFAPLSGEEAERVAKAAKEAPPLTPRPQPRTQGVSAASRGAGGRVAAVVLILILLAAAGAAGWYYFIYPRSPKYAAEQFLKALQAKDYEKVYQTCVWTGPLAFIRSGQDVRQAFEMAEQLGADVGIESYAIKEVSVEGNQATVKTAVKRSNDDSDWNLTMVKGEDGTWKCDMWSSVASALVGSLRLPAIPGR